MPKPIHVGAFRNLERALAAAITDHKRQHGPLAPLHVVVPTRLLGLHLQRTLARALPTGHINVTFLTLNDFISRPAPPRALELLCRKLAPAGPYAPIRETRGFARALHSTFTDLHEAGVKAVPNRDLHDAYTAYTAWLKDHHWQTEADLFLHTAIAHRPAAIFLYGFYDLNHAQCAFVERLAPAAIFFPTESAYAQPLLKWFQSLGYRAVPVQSKIENPKSKILSCPGETAEVREAVRQIVAFLRAHPNKTFNDVAILCRSREQYDAILRDTLAHLDIPAYFRGGRPLSELPDARRLLLLLEVIRTDYSRAAIMELACHIGPNSHWDALTVQLGIVGGQTQWNTRVPADHTPLRDFLKTIFGIGMPARARWSQFIEAALAGWRKLGGDTPAIETAVHTLAILDEIESPVGFDTFADYCARSLDSERIQTGQFQGGGIFVSDVMGARGLSFPLVIVLGLVEKSFPRVVREDPLLPDEDRARISPVLPQKARGYDEERLLFELATGAATEQLILSYPRLEAGSSRPRVPSCFLLEQELETTTIPLTPAQKIADPLEEREFDLPVLTPETLDIISPLLSLGFQASRNRWQEHKLTRHDGLLVAPAAQVILRDRFLLEKLVTSATALEDFFGCPFYYFQKHILHVEEWDEPEATFAIEALDLGTLYHRILEDFYRDGQSLDKICAKRFAEFEAQGVTGYPTVWTIKKEIIREELAAFIARDQRNSSGQWKPAEFEKSFDNLNVAPPVQLRGKIDRIDFSPDGQRARILDYKTGKTPRGLRDDSFAKGEALQLPLYLLATEKLFPAITVESACYAYFTLRGGFQTVSFSRDALRQRENELDHLLQTVSGMIHTGIFAQYATKDGCRFCEFRPICGNGIVKLYVGKNEAVEMAAFRQIKEESA